MTNKPGPTTIIVIRHAEKPGQYGGVTYNGVNPTATVCESAAAEDLTTTGWQRAGSLVTLFGPHPFGPRADLTTPDHLYAADPAQKQSDKTPSQRPYDTLLPVSAVLGQSGTPMKIHTQFAKSKYAEMVTDVLTRTGVVLICWQHEDIPLDAGGQPGISQEILTQTGTTAIFAIPQNWPKDANGDARYDLIFVFTRSAETGQIVAFDLLPQYLVAGDGHVATQQQSAAGVLLPPQT
jgi:hypothetical protein